MRTFTEKELRDFWKLMKAKWKKKHIMDFYNITSDEATDMYNQAEKLHGGGYREPKETPEIETAAKKKQEPYTRPAAQYSNRTREQVIEELEKKQI